MSTTEIIVRPVTTRDIGAINDLYQQEYGDYPYQLTEDGIRIGIQVVAECKEGKIRGFARAKPVPNHNGVVELGGIIIDPEKRGNGVAKRLTHARLDAAIAQGMIAAISEPVCNRPDLASQLNLEHEGFVPLGISVTKYPGIKQHIGQPETVTFAMRALQGDTGFGRRRVYLPDDIAQVIAAIVPSMVMERGWNEDLPPPCPDPHLHNPYIGKHAIGSTFVDLPINWPDAIEEIRQWRAQGYTFCGVLPGLGETHGHTYDQIRMYKAAPGLDINWNVIHVTERLTPLKNWLMARRA
jgi:hypothetical protein